MDWKNAKKLKSRETKFIRRLKIATLTQPNTAKYVHLPNLLKCTGSAYQIFEHFTWSKAFMILPQRSNSNQKQFFKKIKIQWVSVNISKWFISN